MKIDIILCLEKKIIERVGKGNSEDLGVVLKWCRDL